MLPAYCLTALIANVEAISSLQRLKREVENKYFKISLSLNSCQWQSLCLIALPPLEALLSVAEVTSLAAF